MILQKRINLDANRNPARIMVNLNLRCDRIYLVEGVEMKEDYGFELSDLKIFVRNTLFIFAFCAVITLSIMIFVKLFHSLAVLMNI